MSLEAIQHGLAALQESIARLQSTIDSLATYRFHGAVPASGLGDCAALCDDIHDTLRDQTDELALLSQEADDLLLGRGSRAASTKAAVLAKAARLADELSV
jgi:hypothetical protein